MFGGGLRRLCKPLSGTVELWDGLQICFVRGFLRYSKVAVDKEEGSVLR